MGGNSGGGESIVPIQGQSSGEMHPKGLMDCIGYLEQSFHNEAGGAKIDPGFITSPLVLEFQSVALKSGLGHGLSAVLLMPISLMVLNGTMPIFGNSNPTAFDIFCGLLLALAHPLGYALLMTYAATKHLGPYSRKMAVQLLGGSTIAWAIKGFLTVIFFHWLYFIVFTTPRMVWFVKLFYRPDGGASLSYEHAVALLDLIRQFRETLITSSYLVAVSALFFTLIPWLAFHWAKMRNKKWVNSGVADVYKEAQQ